MPILDAETKDIVIRIYQKTQKMLTTKIQLNHISNESKTKYNN